MLVHSLAMESRKKLVHDAVDTFGTYASHIHDVYNSQTQLPNTQWHCSWLTLYHFQTSIFNTAGEKKKLL